MYYTMYIVDHNYFKVHFSGFGLDSLKVVLNHLLENAVLNNINSLVAICSSCKFYKCV